MPRQNRVLPTGEIVAIPARGTLTGNRGILHDADGRLGRARWRHKAWISCLTEFRGWRRQVMAPDRWTELFFLDEAVAMAAGHRPCALCRRDAYNAFRLSWGNALRAPEMDAVLHAERLDGRSQRRHLASAAEVPPGAFVLVQDMPHLVMEHGLLPYTPTGYGSPCDKPEGHLTVLTPPSLCRALRHGYRPLLHPTTATAMSRPG